jgi:putative tryptophan/tyrosine transport system substrate-binding protein
MHFAKLKRREFISLVGGAVAACPFAARAQQPAMPVIGLLVLPDPFMGRLRAFHQGLNELGYHQGRNVAIEHTWDGQYGRLPAAAAELVRHKVAVIVAASTPGALAAKDATTTVPIVFNVGVDPIEAGLVSSLNRPGGNVTGVSNLNVELGSKQLELLHEVVPAVTSIAVLVNPNSPAFAEPLVRQLQAGASVRKLQLHVLRASTESEFDPAFATLAGLRAGALVIASDPFLNSRSEWLAALALRHAMPTMHQIREFPAAGGLMGYGNHIPESYRLMGNYAGRILNGEKPSDLPVQQATKIHLVINLKTAKALGLTIPPMLLARADEVIE